jgi:hypothetical protein
MEKENILKIIESVMECTEGKRELTIDNHQEKKNVFKSKITEYTIITVKITKE